MANVLEGLIAKGRRVHHIREQREVAFGLADLSTHEELHQRMVKKGAVKTLIHLLTSSRDIEAQRFSALALANTACTTSYRVEIATQEKTLLHLTEYIKNEENDLLMRQYCAMALGNLAADVENHYDIAEVGGIEALVVLLKYGAENDEIDVGRYAAFALSNLAANSVHRKHIVDSGAIESLIIIACANELNAQRQALNALRGLCVNHEVRTIVVQAGILDPLILMARSEAKDIVREVAAALSCLSSVPENKEEVANRAISTIIAMLMSGDHIIERHACCTMANLTEMVEIHPRLLEEEGLPSITSMFASKDLNCKGEAARALANLSSNATIQHYLVKDEILVSVVEALAKSEVNCQRFAALCLANLATTVSSQIKVVEAGAIFPLVAIVECKTNHLEARRYACLALANLSATVANHAMILKNDGLKALFSLANSPDVMSQFYVGCTMANVCSNIENHSFVIEQGGIQPLVAFAYSSDPDVQTQAAAALRGLSASDYIKMKIVQEGGLEPMSRLLLGNEIELLRQVTACFCNLSLGDENKIEIAKCGAIPPLITLMQSEDMEISSHCSACLANLAELSDNQELIASEGAIKPCQWVMRSRFIDVQREAGRLLANLCACHDVLNVTNIIVDNGGHKQLMSYLLSRNIALQRVGVFGIGNLCTHACHRVTLCDAGVLEPLSVLVQSKGVNMEIQQFALIAIVNLADEPNNHHIFLRDRILQLMISLSSADEVEMRQYAAVSIVNLAKNMDLREIVTEEGGLEPILYLARTHDADVRRRVLPALTTLSFVDANKEDVCKRGGIEAIIQEICRGGEEDIEHCRLACCALANLSECVPNLVYLHDANVIPLLIEIFVSCTEEDIRTETARAIGNFSANLDYGEILINEDCQLIPQLVHALSAGGTQCQRMVSMTLSNISVNTKFHSQLIQSNIFDVLPEIFRISLDTKCESDHETCHFSLLLLANLATNDVTHSRIVPTTLPMLIEFSKHRNIKCRQASVIILGNLCANKQNVDHLCEAGAMRVLISFSFPPADIDTTNAQFQAITGVRGLSIDARVRIALVENGCVEPLLIAAANQDGLARDIEVRREAGAVLYNLSLSTENGIKMVQLGVVGTLMKLVDTLDVVCQVFAIGALANLAERDNDVQARILHDGCLAPLINHVEKSNGSVETKHEVSRCLALFANNEKSHGKLMFQRTLKCIVKLMQLDEDFLCIRFASLCIANLGLSKQNHSSLIKVGVLDALSRLASSDDVETIRCVAFALHNFCKNETMHSFYENAEIARSLTVLIKSEDNFTKLHACLALKYFSISIKARASFVDNGGLKNLLSSALHGNIELKLEIAASLRNLSISHRNKVEIIKEGGMSVLTAISRTSDLRLCHQTAGVLANLAEASENQDFMVKEGILHHLNFLIRSNSTEVLRECLRTIANISFDFICTEAIIGGGVLIPLIQSLSSDDNLCREYATMSMANLATNKKNHIGMVLEGSVEPLIIIASDYQANDDFGHRYAYFALTNLISSRSNQETLIMCGIVPLSVSLLLSEDRELKLCAALCLSNLASNTDHHKTLDDSNCINHVYNLLDDDTREMRLRAMAFFRGISSNSRMRTALDENVMTKVLHFATSQDVEIQIEAIATLCNMSLDGLYGSHPQAFLDKIHMNDLLSFLCSSNATCALFGAISIGNVASSIGLHRPLLEGGSLQPLIEVANIADLETQRCIAYALCNLCAEENNRYGIIQNGGLIPIFSLAFSNDNIDALAALSVIRGLASSPVSSRDIVLTGGLEPLFAIIMSRSYEKDCVLQACLALVALSVNDENKIAIVKYVHFKYLLDESVTGDIDIAILAIRTLANCSERTELQELIFAALNGTFPTFKKCCGVSLYCELSRLYSNFACSKHLSLSLEIPQKLLCVIDENDDETIVLNVILGLVNITSNIDFFGDIIVSQKLFDQLVEYCSSHLGDGVGCKICRYACLTIGNLIRYHDFCRKVQATKVLDILLLILNQYDVETKFNASYGLHQLSMKTDVIEIFTQVDAVNGLLNYITDVEPNLSTHAISAIRYLSIDDQISKSIAKLGGFTILTSTLVFAKPELKREICSILCHLTIQMSNKAQVAHDKTLLDEIVKLINSSDMEIVRFSLATIANITEDPSSHELILSMDSIMKVFVKKMKNKTLSIKREATRVISNLLSCQTSHQHFFDADGLDSICHVSRTIDSECQYCAGMCLNKLASSFFNHDQIMESGSLHTILNLAKLKNNVSAARQAASSLRRLSSNKEFKQVIVQQGGLIVATALLEYSDTPLKVLGAGILEHLSIASTLKNFMCENGVLEAVADCIRTAENEDVMFHCARTLLNIAEHSQARNSLWDDSVICCLLKMASHPSQRIQSQTARTFTFMSSTSNMEIHNEETVSKILDITIVHLKSTQTSIASDAAITVGNFAVDAIYQRLLCKLQSIEPLSSLLGSNSIECCFGSCRAISRISLPNENKLKCIEDKNLLKNLINLCSLQNEEIIRLSSMTMCNLSFAKEAHETIADLNGIEALLSLIDNDCDDVVIAAMKALCNLASNKNNQDRIIDANGILSLYKLLYHNNDECATLATFALSNLCSERSYNKSIMTSGSLYFFSKFLRAYTANVSQKIIATTEIVYNLSTLEDNHVALVKSSIIDSIKKICKCNNVQCRKFSIMTLSNLSGNEITRYDAIKSGGLQTVIQMLKDDDNSCKAYACICLANMANNSITQNQIILHGGLPSLTAYIMGEDHLTIQTCAIMCVINLAANVANHNPMLRQGILHNLSRITDRVNNEMGYLCAFAVANMLSGDDLIDYIGTSKGVEIIFHLAKSKCDHFKCLAFASIRKLTSSSKSRTTLIEQGVLKIIQCSGIMKNIEILREIAAIICNLSQDTCHREDIIQTSLKILTVLIKSDDLHAVRHASGALGNLSEDDEYHNMFVATNSIGGKLMSLLKNEHCAIRREVSRVLCNLLSSIELHEFIINDPSFEYLVSLSGDSDHECQYNAVLSCRKVTIHSKIHGMLLRKGLVNFFRLLKSNNANTNKHVAAILRDLSARKDNIETLASNGGIDELNSLLKSEIQQLQILGAASLRHISVENTFKRAVVASGTVALAIQCLIEASDDLMCQIAGLFANLSESADNQIEMIDDGVISAIMTLSKVKKNEIVIDVTRTIANLSANVDRQVSIYHQGAFSCLISLSEQHDDLTCRYISVAIQILCTNSEICKFLLREWDIVLKIVRFASSQSIDLKRSAAIAILCFTNIEEGKRKLTGNKCIDDLFLLCNDDDIQIQRDAMCAIANISDSRDTHVTLIHHGALHTISKISNVSFDLTVVQEISRFFSLISITDDAKTIMVEQNAIKSLIKFARSSDVPTQQYSILTLCNLSLSRQQKQSVLQYHGLISTLIYLTRCPDLEVNRCTVLAITALLLGADDVSKYQVANAGVIPLFFKMLTFPDTEIQQCTSLALSTIVLGQVEEVKRRFISDEKDFSSVLFLLKSDCEECLHNGIHTIGSLMENSSILHILVEQDCIQHVTTVASTSHSVEVLRACGYVFSLIVEHKQYHSDLFNSGAMKEIVGLAALVDLECQLYGSFSLVFLSGNHDYQVPLVKLGAVRPLVAMMANESEPRHYAGLALLKLADNFENHITIAEEGGIQALLKLGRSQVADEEVQYKAALTVGKAALTVGNVASKNTRPAPTERDNYKRYYKRK